MPAPKITLMQGDCLELMKNIPDGSVDMVLADPPYGTTRNKWDSVIPLAELKESYLRVLKPNGVICLHTDQPFTAEVVTVFRNVWRYELVWIKEQGSDFLNANRKPMKAHETIQVCYRKQPTFNKQKMHGKPYKARSGDHKSENWGGL